MASPFLKYSPAAKVDKGGRNRNGRTLRAEHLAAQRMVVEGVVSEVAAKRLVSEAEAHRLVEAKLAEMRALMGAPKGQHF